MPLFNFNPVDVNGVRTSYCSIEFEVDGMPIVDVDEINYGAPGDIPKLRGTHHQAIGRPRGSVDHEGSIVLAQKAWKKLLPKITRFGLVGFMRLAWTIKVTYAEEQSPQDTVTDRLIGARFHSPDIANSQGNDPTKLRVSLSLMEIIWANKYRAL